MRVIGWFLLILGIIEAGWVIGDRMQLSVVGIGAEGQPSLLALIVRSVITAALIFGGVQALEPPASVRKPI